MVIGGVRWGLATVAVLGTLVFASNGWALKRTLDFEGLKDQESVARFYDGGEGSLGSVGPDYDIAFSATVARMDADAGGTGDFAGEPSPPTVVEPLEHEMRIDAYVGFLEAVAGKIASDRDDVKITVYDGPDGTGNVLGTKEIAGTVEDPGCTGDPTGSRCTWNPFVLSFDGVARSLVIRGVGVLLDDLSLVVADADGDSVPDATDNCPGTANAAQTDGDGDGTGDACDPTPSGECTVVNISLRLFGRPITLCLLRK
jgi:hypothetical protein